MTELITRRVPEQTTIRPFEEEWPELERRVRCSLVSRGAPPWLRDDIVQETALRLFRMWDEIDPERSMFGLALTIAQNLLWDEQHRKARGEVLGLIPDVPGEQDVERSGIAREELGRVYRLLPRLNLNHRKVLLAEIGGEAPVTASGDALKMLRLRARRKLTALMESASAGIFVMGFELRRLGWRVSSAIRRHSIPGELPAGAVVAFCGVFAVLMVPLPTTPAPAAGVDEVLTETRDVTPLLRAVDEFLPGPDAPRTLDTDPAPKRPARVARVEPAGDRYHFAVGDEGPVNGEAG
ncbi:MAG: Sigma-70 region 2, partial [Actinomycetota bacterium]|nr:Sigma-70 region 2 [Actinomycetota bacterium]